MKLWGYRIGSLLAGSLAFWALDIHVGFLRLMAGALLICASLGMWEAAGKRSEVALFLPHNLVIANHIFHVLSTPMPNRENVRIESSLRG